MDSATTFQAPKRRQHATLQTTNYGRNDLVGKYISQALFSSFIRSHSPTIQIPGDQFKGNIQDLSRWR